MGKLAVVVIFLISLGSLWGIGWAKEATEPDYFPLQLGNRWVYGYFYNGKEGGTKELVVVDTVTIGEIEGPTLFRSLPTSSEGSTYYKLSGAMVDVFFIGAEADTALARKDASGDLLVRGLHYRESGLWSVEPEDRIWFRSGDLIRFSRGELSEEELVDRFWRWEVSLGSPTGTRVWAYQIDFWPRVVSVPAGSFSHCYRFERQTVNPGISHTEARMLFAAEVGLVRVSLSSGMLEIKDPHLALKEAIVAGIHYPMETTSGEEATWGQIKAYHQNK